MLLLRNICLVAAAVLAAGAVSFAEETVPDSGSGAGAGRNVMQVKLFMVQNHLELEIDSDRLSESIMYLPNAPTSLGIGMSYNGFGMRLSNSLTSGVDDKNLYGTTKARDYQLYYYGISFCVDLIYQSYMGFYLDSPELYGYSAGDSSTIRGDIEMRNVGFNLYYVFSERLSLPAAFEQIGRQHESGGSFLLMMSLQKQDLSADSSLVPAPVESTVGAQYHGGMYLNGILGGGYGYSFICGNFFITPVLVFGAGVARAHEDRGLDSVTHYVMGSKLIVKLALGYNGESVFWGLVALLDSVMYWGDDIHASSSGLGGDQEPVDVYITSGYVEFFMGLRF